MGIQTIGAHRVFDEVISSLDYKSIQVNRQLLPVWSTFLAISLEKQYTQLNSAHNMNNTSEMVTLSVIALNMVAPVKNGWILKWPKKIMKIIFSPGVPYLQVLVIFGHKSYI